MNVNALFLWNCFINKNFICEWRLENNAFKFQLSVQVYISLIFHWQVTQCWEVSVLSQAWSLGWACHQFLISCHTKHRSLYPGIGRKGISSIEYIIIWQKWGTVARRKTLGKSSTLVLGFYTRTCEVNQATCWDIFNWLSTFNVSTRTIYLFFYSLFRLY